MEEEAEAGAGSKKPREEAEGRPAWVFCELTTPAHKAVRVAGYKALESTRLAQVQT